jgi:hypothetical protein
MCNPPLQDKSVRRNTSRLLKKGYEVVRAELCNRSEIFERKGTSDILFDV